METWLLAVGAYKSLFLMIINVTPQGPGRVKEREENVLVWRLQVKDQDTKGTAAWRAKYQIQGDTNNNFRIRTDPDSNEGLLYVEKVFCLHSYIN